MRHNKKGRKLGTDASHTKAMKRSLVGALLANDRIKTIEARAKEIRPDVDRIITWAKRGDLHSRRLAIAYLGDKDLVREVFEKVEQGMFQGRDGGYTRILKIGARKGDNAPMVIMELVGEAARKKKSSSSDQSVKPKRTGRIARAKETAKEAAATAGADASEEGVEALGAESAEEVIDAVKEPERAEAQAEEEARADAEKAEEAAAENAEAAEAEKAEKEKPE